MRFHVGPPPDDFEPDGSWRPIWEPGPLLLQLFALPVALASMVGVAAAWQPLLEPAGADRTQFQMDYMLLVLVAAAGLIVAIIFVHEMLHALAFPHCGLSRETIIAAWPSKLLFYAHYSGALSRNRFLIVFMVPLLVITGVPLLLAALGLLPATVKLVAMFCSVMNACFACGDLIGIALIFFQVPRRALVRNKVWRTYWRPMDNPQ